MNFISLAVSMFISNYFIMAIIRVLPLKNKRVWQIGIITVANVSPIIGYLISLFTITSLTFLTIIDILGSILGVLIAYTASMMIILDGISIFKSRRLREFERNIKNKDGKSLPRSILSLICMIIFGVLLAYSIISGLNYDEKILVSFIGTIIGSVISLGLAIYFFISSRPIHKTIKAENLLFIINLPEKKKVFKKELSKDFTYEDALGELLDTYMIDEYGMLITANERYLVKGIKVNQIDQATLSKIRMEPYEEPPFGEALDKYQKYNRKKIFLDENNHITKITNIK